MSLRIIFILTLIGVAAFGAYGFSNTLISTGYNEIQTIQIVSSHPESILEMNLGTNADVTEVELKFVNDDSWGGRTVTVDIHDLNDILIGTGSIVAHSESFKVTLSNIVTATERPDLRKITVTAT